MKIMIGIPCMDKVDTVFMTSLLGLHRPQNAQIHFNIKKGSLIFDARNQIAADAINQGADRVLMIDSDMTFKPDLLERLNERLDQGYDMVCGLFFQRVLPTKPVIYEMLEPPVVNPDGSLTKRVVTFMKYPRDDIFMIDGCGFGAVMMTTEVIKSVWDEFGPAFTPFDWCGEDMAFCYRAKRVGWEIHCDSSIKVGHMGQVEFNEETWLKQHNGMNVSTDEISLDLRKWAERIYNTNRKNAEKLIRAADRLDDLEERVAIMTEPSVADADMDFPPVDEE